MKNFRTRIYWRVGLIVVLVMILFVGVWYFDSQSMAKANKFIRELREAEKILRKEPENFGALMEAGVAAYNLRRFSAAVDYYTRATQVKPEEAVVWNNLANVERDLKRFSDAEDHYRKAIGFDSSEAQYYINLADLYRLWAKEEPEKQSEIEKTLLQGLEVLPNQPALIHLLAQYYEGMGELAKATELRQRLVK